MARTIPETPKKGDRWAIGVDGLWRVWSSAHSEHSAIVADNLSEADARLLVFGAVPTIKAVVMDRGVGYLTAATQKAICAALANLQPT